MSAFSLGDVIASRRLFVEENGQESISILVKLGMPQPSEDLREFVCPFVVEGVGDQRVHVAYGIDAFQALSEAIRVLGIYLHEKINPEFGNRLRWAGGVQGEIGFPKRIIL